MSVCDSDNVCSVYVAQLDRWIKLKTLRKPQMTTTNSLVLHYTSLLNDCQVYITF